MLTEFPWWVVHSLNLHQLSNIISNGAIYVESPDRYSVINESKPTDYHKKCRPHSLVLSVSCFSGPCVYFRMECYIYLNQKIVKKHKRNSTQFSEQVGNGKYPLAKMSVEFYNVRKLGSHFKLHEFYSPTWKPDDPIPVLIYNVWSSITW